uniref:Uncharacterized protein n=2 Tax=Magallana gigas TaxID=29159 RepID=A0A8W8JF56_MAGGI
MHIIKKIFNERYLLVIKKMEKWFWITALFLLMDLITLAIDCIFHRAFKDFKATPNGLSQKDAKDLKAPVLAFVVLETIFVVMKIAITVYFLLKGPDRYVKEKKDWPFIISVFDVWFDFAQTVIALTTAFKMDDEMQLGYVQFAKPCSSQRSLLKTYVQFEYDSADKDPRKQSYCYRVEFHQSNGNYLQLFYRAIQSSSGQS